ncbi:hypothetical protein FALBO_4856 [Fusarium albosuccineum]|uniref:Uncharacterized protein n=1 Tax=Fusarium albosuccineum TaxID=1237068 RepID=A0A8H4LHL1_9HYPO|nr:hypothetical protein FALBO_4856 [Fusarium albosuccineum]
MDVQTTVDDHRLAGEREHGLFCRGGENGLASLFTPGDMDLSEVVEVVLETPGVLVMLSMVDDVTDKVLDDVLDVLDALSVGGVPARSEAEHDGLGLRCRIWSVASLNPRVKIIRAKKVVYWNGGCGQLSEEANVRLISADSAVFVPDDKRNLTTVKAVKGVGFLGKASL